MKFEQVNILIKADGRKPKGTKAVRSYKNAHVDLCGTSLCIFPESGMTKEEFIFLGATIAKDGIWFKCLEHIERSSGDIYRYNEIWCLAIGWNNNEKV